MAKENRQITLYWGKEPKQGICFFLKNKLLKSPLPCKPKDLEKTILSIVDLVDRRR